MDAIGTVSSAIMVPLYYAVTAILLAWQEMLAGLLPDAPGWAWALAIVGLTVTIRMLLIPLYVQQVKATRAMHDLQPRIRDLQERYKDDRKRLTEEQMKLWKETGTNPFASCLPLLLQLPIFFALERVLDRASRFPTEGAIGYMSHSDVQALSNAEVAGARLADSIMDSASTEATILATVLTIAMCASQFASQFQLLKMSPTLGDTDDPYAQQQKGLLFVLPIVFAVGGLAFPIGVLLYWTTSNLWTLAQTSRIMRQDPPGSGGNGVISPG